MSFKEIHTKEERLIKYMKHKQDHPDHIAIVMERQKSSKIPHLSDRRNFLIYAIKKTDRFRYIREHILKVLKQKMENRNIEVYFYVGNQQITQQSNLQQLYKKYHDEQDSFLYMQYSEKIKSNTNYLPYVLGAIGLLGVVYITSVYLKDRLFNNNLNNYTDSLKAIQK